MIYRTQENRKRREKEQWKEQSLAAEREGASSGEGRNRRSGRTGAGGLLTLFCLFLAVCAFEVFSLQDFCSAGILTGNTKILTIGFFYGDTDPRGFEGVQNTVLQAVREYRERYPDVEIRFEKGILREDYSEWLMGKYLEGTEPDVFVVQQEDLAVLAAKDMLMPLTEYPAENGTAFYVPLLEACQWNGTLYALPVMCNPQMMAVNADLVREYVGHGPYIGWNWSEFHQMCRKCTGAGGGPEGQPRYGAAGYTWEMAAASNAAKIFDETGRENYLDETKCVQAVTFCSRLSGLMSDLTGFESGQVAFTPMWACDWRKYSTAPYTVKKEYGFSWYCSSMPGGPAGGNISQTEMLAAAVSGRCACREEAKRFLQILTGDCRVQQSVVEETWSLPASSEILPQLAVSAQSEVSESAVTENDAPGRGPRESDTPERDAQPQNSPEVSPDPMVGGDYELFDQILQNVAVIRRFSGYEDLLRKADNEIREAGAGTGNFNVSLRRISRTLEEYVKNP